MTGPKNRDWAALDRLTVALVDDVLKASDADILAEAKEDGVDLAAEAAAGRAIFEKARTIKAKDRLTTAKKAVAADRQSGGAHVVKLDPQEARRRLTYLLERNPGIENQLTLAARKGVQRSDEDIQSMLEDLAELGLASLDDGEKDQ